MRLDADQLGRLAIAADFLEESGFVAEVTDLRQLLKALNGGRVVSPGDNVYVETAERAIKDWLRNIGFITNVTPTDGVVMMNTESIQTAVAQSARNREQRILDAVLNR